MKTIVNSLSDFHRFWISKIPEFKLAVPRFAGRSGSAASQARRIGKQHFFPQKSQPTHTGDFWLNTYMSIGAGLREVSVLQLALALTQVVCAVNQFLLSYIFYSSTVTSLKKKGKLCCNACMMRALHITQLLS